MLRKILIVLALTAGLLRPDEAERIYKRGRKAERAGDMASAYLLYSEAAALQPAKQLYWLRSQAVRSRAALAARPGPAPRNTPADPAPGPPLDTMDDHDRAAERQPLPPPELKPQPGLRDFNLRADARSLFEQVSRAYGLDTVFDGDYGAGPPIHFTITGAGYRDALHALEAATGSFIVPLSEKLIFIVKDSEQKRRQAEPTIALTVPIPQALTPQEINEIAQGVRQLFTVEHLAFDSAMNMLVIRDRFSRALAARQVAEQLMHPRPQVQIEMEFVEVDRSLTRELGLQLPTSFPLFYLGGILNSLPSISNTIGGLLTFGGGKTMFGFGLSSAQLFATESRSKATTLLKMHALSVDAQPVSFHVGQKYPILTAGYFGRVPSGNTGQTFAPPPAFNFEDLGVVMKVTPRIHSIEELSLELELEFKVLAGQAFNGIPVISSRSLKATVRLRDGEWGVVAGAISTSDARTISGIAGLANLPAIGPLMRHNTRDNSASDVLIVLKPSLVSLPADQLVTREIRTGSETRPFTPL